MHQSAQPIIAEPVTTQSTPTREVISWSIQDIIVPPRLRAVDPDSVRTLADSIQTLGLLEPIVIRDGLDDQGKPAVVVVAGAHRLAACKLLGFEKIDVFLFEGTDDEARQIEITENLHRNDLTPLQRADHINLWRRMIEGPEVAQVAPVSGGRGKRGGTRKTARVLGVERTDLQRAEKLGKLTPDARMILADHPELERNRVALLRIADAGDDTASQVAQIEVEVAKAATRQRTVTDPRKAFLATATEAWEQGYTRLFNTAGDEWNSTKAPPSTAPTTSTLPAHLIAERDAFCAIAPWEETHPDTPRKQEFLGFTREEWLEASVRSDHLYHERADVFRPFRYPHPDLLASCGMAEAVDRWRTDAALNYNDGEEPIPEYWNRPDLIAAWEQANPELHAEREAKRQAKAKAQAEWEEKERKRAERAARKAAKVAAAGNAVGGTTTAPVEPDMTDCPVP